MRIVKVPFPDISYYPKTRLATSPGQPQQTVVEAESSSLYVRNSSGFFANDFVVLEAFEYDIAEIVQVSTVDNTSDPPLLDLGDGQTTLDHAVGAFCMKVPYNQVRVYSGASSDITTHTEITGYFTTDNPPVWVSTPYPLAPNAGYTYYMDQTGTSVIYYSYLYWNSFSQSSAGAIQTLYQDSTYDSILSVNDLQNHFMFGLDLTDDDGYPFPTSMFEFAIRAAVRKLEKTIQIKLMPTVYSPEYQDFFGQDYRDFAFIQLNNYPILSVEKVQIKYPTAQSPVDFPVEWVQLRPSRGQIHLIPTSGSLSTILIGQGGDYLTFVWRGYDFMPNLWRIWYTAGMTNGPTYVDSLGNIQTAPVYSTVPDDILGVIGKMACFYPLNIAGDLVGGIAIASKSIGLDGLSQSINTTSCVHPDVLVRDVAIADKFSKISEIGIPTKMWDGNLISITVKGKNEYPLIITPNHLISTNRGWVEAENINDIDELDQGDGTFKKIATKKLEYFKGQLYDMVNQPNEKYITYQSVIHNSPENAGYSARLRQYERELKLELPQLIQYYKSFRMAAL